MCFMDTLLMPPLAATPSRARRFNPPLCLKDLLQHGWGIRNHGSNAKIRVRQFTPVGGGEANPEN